jgi:hypothetical protein
MRTYEPCLGSGATTVGAYRFRNESGSAKFAHNVGKWFGQCPTCGKGLNLGRTGPNHPAPIHKPAADH